VYGKQTVNGFVETYHYSSGVFSFVDSDSTGGSSSAIVSDHMINAGGVVRYSVNTTIYGYTLDTAGNLTAVSSISSPYGIIQDVVYARNFVVYSTTGQLVANAPYPGIGTVRSGIGSNGRHVFAVKAGTSQQQLAGLEVYLVGLLPTNVNTTYTLGV
jgi:hypothetical protein